MTKKITLLCRSDSCPINYPHYHGYAGEPVKVDQPEGGGEPAVKLGSPQLTPDVLADEIEKIIFRRCLEHKLEGYTLETSREISQVVRAGTEQRGRECDCSCHDEKERCAMCCDGRAALRSEPK
jgi:hypothetical protein